MNELPPFPWDSAYRPTAAEVHAYLALHPRNPAVIDWWRRMWSQIGQDQSTAETCRHYHTEDS